MYTFVFIANQKDELTETFLRDCAKITKKWMPAMDVGLAEDYTVLSDCHSGWFWLAPDCEANQKLVSQCVSERYAGVSIW